MRIGSLLAGLTWKCRRPRSGRFYNFWSIPKRLGRFRRDRIMGRKTHRRAFFGTLAGLLTSPVDRAKAPAEITDVQWLEVIRLYEEGRARRVMDYYRSKYPQMKEAVW